MGGTAAGDAAFARNPRVVYRDLAEEEGGVLLHLDTGQYHGVNPTGSMIWHLLEDPQTPASVAEELRRRLDDPSPALERDVAQFLADLRERDLVE